MEPPCQKRIKPYIWGNIYNLWYIIVKMSRPYHNLVKRTDFSIKEIKPGLKKTSEISFWTVEKVVLGRFGNNHSEKYSWLSAVNHNASATLAVRVFHVIHLSLKHHFFMILKHQDGWYPNMAKLQRKYIKENYNIDNYKIDLRYAVSPISAFVHFSSFCVNEYYNMSTKKMTPNDLSII